MTEAGRNTLEWMAPVSVQLRDGRKPRWVGGISPMRLRVVDAAEAPVVVRHRDRNHGSVSYRAFDGLLWGELKQPFKSTPLTVDDIQISKPADGSTIVDEKLLNTPLRDGWYQVFHSAIIDIEREIEEIPELVAAEAEMRRRSADMIVIDGSLWRRCHGPVVSAYGLGSSRREGTSIELLAFFDRPSNAASATCFSAFDIPRVIEGIDTIYPGTRTYGHVGIEVLSSEGWSMGDEIEQVLRQSARALIGTMLEQSSKVRLSEAGSEVVRVHADARALLAGDHEAQRLLSMARTLRETFQEARPGRIRYGYPLAVGGYRLEGWDATISVCRSCLGDLERFSASELSSLAL